MLPDWLRLIPPNEKETGSKLLELKVEEPKSTEKRRFLIF